MTHPQSKIIFLTKHSSLFPTQVSRVLAALTAALLGVELCLFCYSQYLIYRFWQSYQHDIYYHDLDFNQHRDSLEGPLPAILHLTRLSLIITVVCALCCWIQNRNRVTRGLLVASLLLGAIIYCKLLHVYVPGFAYYEGTIQTTN